MKILLFMLLLTAGAALVVGLKIKWRSEAGKKAFLIADVAVILVLSVSFLIGTSGSTGVALSDQGNETLKLSHFYVIGESLGKQAEGKKIALVMSSELAESELKDKIVGALKAGTGLDADITVIEVEASRAKKIAEDAEVKPDWSTLVSAADYDRALGKCGNAKILVFASELPLDYGRMTLWRRTQDRPEIYLVNANPRFEEVVKKKIIAGITKIDPKADFTDLAIPADYKAAFGKRYQFVSAR